jgi:hypothetical protein
MATLKFPLSGLISRVRGKTAAALGLYGYLFVGAPTNTDAVASGSPFGIFKTSGAPTNGTSGTYAGIATPGSLLVDVAGKALYQNTNTQASPTWTAAPLTGVAGITSGAIDGATIGGVTPEPGTFTNLSLTGFQTDSIANALTASVTHTLAGGLALTKMINRLTVVASAGDAVTLPTLTPGQWCDVFNDGANAASVFPHAAGVTIDGGAGGAAVTLTNGKRARYLCVAANTLISAQFGAVSA